MIRNRKNFTLTSCLALLIGAVGASVAQAQFAPGGGSDNCHCTGEDKNGVDVTASKYCATTVDGTPCFCCPITNNQGEVVGMAAKCEPC